MATQKGKKSKTAPEERHLTAVEEPKTKYFIKTRTDEFVIEIPSIWKITFARVNPGSDIGGDRNAHCIRVYEMPGNALRAVFDSAISIRDMSIPLARKVQTEVAAQKWERDSAGSFKGETERQVQSAYHLESGEEVEFN